MEGPLDSHFLNAMEMKIENISFVRVDSDTVEKLIVKEDEAVSLLSKEQEEKLKSLAEKNVPVEQYAVVLEQPWSVRPAGGYHPSGVYEENERDVGNRWGWV